MKCIVLCVVLLVLIHYTYGRQTKIKYSDKGKINKVTKVSNHLTLSNDDDDDDSTLWKALLAVKLDNLKSSKEEDDDNTINVFIPKLSQKSKSEDDNNNDDDDDDDDDDDKHVNAMLEILALQNEVNSMSFSDKTIKEQVWWINLIRSGYRAVVRFCRRHRRKWFCRFARRLGRKIARWYRRRFGRSVTMIK